MSTSLMQRYTLVTLLLGLMLLAAGPVSAGTESTTEQWLVFSIGTDTASVRYCDYDNDSLLIIPFRVMKADGDGSDTITAVETRIIYDSEVLDLVSVEVNSEDWPYNFTYTDTVAGDTNYIFMLFEDTTGVGIPAYPQYSVMAYMSFKFNCNDATGDSHIIFRQGENLNWVDYKNGGIYDPGVIITGYARLVDFWCDYWVEDTVLYNAVGDTIDIPVWMQNNFKNFVGATSIQFDTSALEYLGTFDPPGCDFIVDGGLLDGDEILAKAIGIGGMTGFDTARMVYVHRFVLDCDAWGDTLTFHFTDSTYSIPLCVYLPVDVSAEDGDLYYRDSAYYSATLVDTLPRYYYDTISYDIALTNSFTAGDVTGSEGDTAGIVVNVNLGTFMEYDDVTSQYAQMDFQGTERDDWKVSMFQVIDDAKSNVISAGNDVTLMTMTTLMTGTPTTLPTWANPYIAGPSFVAMNTAAYDSSAVPATACGAAATYGNGLLTWGDFPSATAAVCQFYNYADNDYKANCDSLFIYAKANAETDSICVTLTVDSDFSISDIGLASGVTATQVTYNTLVLESDGSFASFGPNDSIFVALVEIECYQSLQGGNAGLAYSNAWASYGYRRIFTDASAGAIIVDCLTHCRQELPVYKNPADGLPTTYALYQNYPNPFNPTTQIQLDLPEAAAWRIEIYNLLGQLVDDFEGYSGAGTVTVEWDASNHATGVYLYRATAGDYVETKKMLFLK